METLLIRVRDEAGRERVQQALRDLEGIEEIVALPPVDEVTQLAEATLAESWESAEDQRWDTLL
ncbi:hypothetical protein [Rudanella lutea]|uniref:hypothetical protein n=1 Tax=Rudanella lutea TaxID=451374 RepID=UPI00039BF987|nr:hypothetical protein [Rudanella lutea]